MEQIHLKSLFGVLLVLALSSFTNCGLNVCLAQEAAESAAIDQPIGQDLLESIEADASQPPNGEARELYTNASGQAANNADALFNEQGVDVWSLIVRGGIFMIPIGLLSFFGVAIATERLIGLRRGRLYPSRFRKSLKQFSRQIDADPRIVYQSCLEHPSSASTIVRSTLLHVGRPLTELKETAAASIQREAERAYSNVRWLNFCAGVAPLLGLLGTVWGLIRAFHDSTAISPDLLAAGQSRTNLLAVGIYEALITTLAGLMVAIPAAVASHYFEGKITRVFNLFEEDIFDLLPRFERYEGNTRFELVDREIVPREYPSATAAHRYAQ